MSRKLFTLASLVVLAGLLLAACGPAPTPAPGGSTVVVQTSVVTSAPEKETVIVPQTVVAPTAPPTVGAAVLRVNIGTYPDTIDPQKSSFVNEIAHLKLFYEGLTRLDNDLVTVPGAAESWEYSEDAKTLTFTIRKDLKYSDGSILNAKRFEYSILRNINPATAGEYAAITDDIAGAADWRSADTSALSAEELQALQDAVQVHAMDSKGAACADYEQADCLTLVIGTTNPAPYFHTVMSLWVTYPAKEENITEGGDQWWNSSKFQIGNGPFVLQNLEPFVRGYFTPNENYWRGQATYDIEYKYINDGAVAFEAYKNNEFDIIAYAAEDLEQIGADATLTAENQLYPGSCTISIMFHNLKEPFTDIKVREAFAMALDREAWARDVDGGLSLPTLTWIPKGYPGYDASETRWGFDPEGAVKALNESTYGGAAGLPEIKVTYADSARNRTRHEWLAAQWQTNLGVSVVLDPVDPTTYTALTKDIATAPLVYRLGWCADYPDPQNWLSVYWKTGGFGERIGYSNPDFDALVNQADAELDPAKRADLYQQAQQLMLADVPMAVMYNTTNHYLVKSWVKGLAVTPQDAGWAGDNDPLTITIDPAEQMHP